MQLEISREERRLLLSVLLAFDFNLADEKKAADSLVERLLDPPGTLHSSPVAKPISHDDDAKCPQPAVHQTAGESTTDRRETGTSVKSGALPPVPAGAELMVLKPTAITNYETRILVSTTTVTLSCWRPELFDAVRARLNKSTTFYVVRKERYLNIIGLKP